MALVVNVRIFLSKIYIPKEVKSRGLMELFELSARAFEMPLPVLDGLTFDATLRTYAVFTSEAAKMQMECMPDVSSVKRRLYDGAFSFGNRLRRELKIKTRGDAMRAARLLYLAIGIDFRANKSNEVTVRHCYFSDFYSCDVCRVISAIDEGLIAGLTAGGRLWFAARITEGNSSCVGAIEYKTLNPKL